MGKFPKKVLKWRCNICDELYDSEDECAECCMDDKDQQIEAWECVECGEIYTEKEDAYSCCE